VKIAHVQSTGRKGRAYLGYTSLSISPLSILGTGFATLLKSIDTRFQAAVVHGGWWIEITSCSAPTIGQTTIVLRVVGDVKRANGAGAITSWPNASMKTEMRRGPSTSTPARCTVSA
jgi:hypothetical protein